MMFIDLCRFLWCQIDLIRTNYDLRWNWKNIQHCFTIRSDIQLRLWVKTQAWFQGILCCWDKCTLTQSWQSFCLLQSIWKINVNTYGSNLCLTEKRVIITCMIYTEHSERFQRMLVHGLKLRARYISIRWCKFEKWNKCNQVFKIIVRHL